jgi:hypothetical protein
MTGRLIYELETAWKKAAVEYLSHHPDIYLEGLRTTMKNLSQDSRSPSLDFNPELVEYKEVVTT